MKETAGAYPCRLVVAGSTFLLEWFLCGGGEPAFMQELRGKKQLLQIGGRTFTTLSALGEAITAPDILKPSLFVYHATRCGSTLLGRMLGSNRENRIFNEPSSVIKLLINSQSIEDRLLKQSHIHNLISAYGLGASSWHKSLAFKFMSLCSFYFDDIRAAFPDTPCIYVYRDPVEIMVGLVAEPAGWLYDEDEIFARFLPMSKEEIAKCSIEELSCLYLEQQFRWVLTRFGSFARLVNYTELPEAAFGIADCYLRSRINDESAAVLPWNAKQPERPFTPDSRRKQQKASPLIRELAETRLYPLYRELEALRGAKLLL